MLGWLEVVSKLFEFTVSKVVERKVDLLLDKKKRAAKDLLVFYDLLVELESLSVQCVETLGPVFSGTKSRLYSVHMSSLAERADSASKRFFEQLERVVRGLEIVAPELAELLGKVAKGKMRNHWAIAPSEAFAPLASERHLVPDTPYLGHIRFTKRQVDEGAWRSLYEKGVRALVAGATQRQAAADQLHNDIVASILLKSEVSVVTIFPEDLAVMRELHADVLRQRDVLQRTREALRDFLRANFTFEDLLYAAPGSRARV